MPVKQSVRAVALFLLVSLSSTVLFAADARSETVEAFERMPICRHCSMRLEHYTSSRMLLTYSDGTVCAFCSIHCLAIDLVLNMDKTPEFIQVGNYDTGALIDAEKAVWVIGGAKSGVMTKRAKWAFADKRAAEAYVERHGGRLADFDKAMEAAYQDMYTDSKMIRSKRKIKSMLK